MKNNVKKIIFALVAVLFTALSAYAFSFRNITLDFIHISDTHISTDRADTSYKALGSSSELLRDAINQINEIKGLDFVLFTGDMVDSATYENYTEYYTLLTKLKYPSLNAFGNHDLLYGTMNKAEVLEFVKKCNPNYRFDNTYYAFTPKTDYRIVVLDPNPEVDLGTANGLLSDDQLKFLDDELNANQDKIVVVALHHPPLQPFAADEHALQNADKMNDILVKYKNPIVVLSGHYHAAKIRQIGNIIYVSTPSMVTYPMAFRHIKIVNFKDRVNFTFEFMPTKLDNIKEINRRTVISYSTLEGLEKDRNLVFTYKKSHHKSPSYKKRMILESVKSKTASPKEIKKLSQPVNKQVNSEPEPVSNDDSDKAQLKPKFKDASELNYEQRYSENTYTDELQETINE